MRVLIANDSYLPQLNGAAVASHRLVQGLAGRGHQVCVVAPGTSFRDEEHPEPSCPEVTVHRIKSFPVRPLHPEFRITARAGTDAKLERIFRRFQPDIVHIQNQFIVCNGCLKQGRKSGIPVVGTNHFMPENVLPYFPKPFWPVMSPILWKHCLRVYNRLDCVLAPSKSCLNVLREAGLTAPARVISNGIDLQRFSGMPSPGSISGPGPDLIHEKYGIRRNVPTFLAVGRLDRDKKVDLIIRATAEVAASSDLQTVIAGKGRDEARFRELARRLSPEGACVFTGFVPDEDLNRLYALADVYIGAGAAELQGLAVMEAMAAGLPILAANSVALPELVEEGVNGLLFELNVDDLATRMLMMLERRNNWDEMGRASKKAMRFHDMPAVLGQVEGLYEELVQSRSIAPI